MWTHFNAFDLQAMETAHYQMNEFKLIKKEQGLPLLPSDTIKLHKIFVEKLKRWFEQDVNGPRVVISHHAPVVTPKGEQSQSFTIPIGKEGR